MAALLLALCVATDAQAVVRFGAEAGVSYGQLSQDREQTFLPVDLDDGPRVEPTAGLLVHWAFHGPWGLTSGLRYTRYADGLSFDFEVVGVSRQHITSENALDYLLIPARIELAPFAGGRFGVSFGPEFGYLIQARRTLTIEDLPLPPPAPGKTSAEIFEDVDGFDDPDRTYERFDVRVTAGVLCNVPLGVHLGRVEARYTYGLTDTHKADLVTQRTRGFDFTVGMVW